MADDRSIGSQVAITGSVAATRLAAVAWVRSRGEAGLRFVAPSQVVVDCLTGNGRMPAEGEAVLEWMAGNEQQWRQNSLDDHRSGQGEREARSP